MACLVAGVIFPWLFVYGRRHAMSTNECPDTITITSQDDVHDDAFSPCKGDQGFKQLTIRTDADGLSLDDFTGGINISVVASPNLQVIVFPDLVALDQLRASDVPALTQIAVPKLRAAAETLVYPITYTLTPSIAVQDALRFGGLSLPALGALDDLVIRHVPRRQTVSGGLARITVARSVTADNVIDYPGLGSVAGALQLTGYAGCGFALPNLTRVAGDFGFANARGSRLLTSSALTVDGSFVLRATPYARAANETTLEFAPPGDDGLGEDFVDLRNMTTVGVNATVESNADTRVDLSGLTTVVGSLSITNNTNCTVDLSGLARVGALVVVDNAGSTVPRFFNLERADSIHLRGHIDTSSGPNIFPSLTFVSGMVAVEAWNADFNCSQLVLQQRQGLINDLRCNGTDNGTTTSLSTPPSSPSQGTSLEPAPQGPSTGAWAGIGVGIGLVVIGLLGGVAWLFIYFRRRFAALEASARQSSTATTAASAAAGKPPELESNTGTDTSSDGHGRSIREVHEADDFSPGRERFSHIPVSHEMFVLPSELPVSHPRRGNL